MASGIELILSKAQGQRVQFVRLDDVAVQKWASMLQVELWQAVALHSYLDPDLLGGSWSTLHSHYVHEDAFQNLLATYASDPSEQTGAAHGQIDIDPQQCLRSNFKRAGDAALMESLQCVALEKRDVMLSKVSLAEFLGWSIRTRLNVVQGFPSRASTPSRARWPWGNHTTPKLELLAEAGEHWRLVADGGRYSAEDIQSAPHSKAIVAWMVRKGVHSSVAESIASMLRPPSLRTGPR